MALAAPTMALKTVLTCTNKKSGTTRLIVPHFKFCTILLLLLFFANGVLGRQRRRSAPQRDSDHASALSMLVVNSILPHLKAARALALTLLQTLPASADQVIDWHTARGSLSKDEPNPLEDGLPTVR
jgi:hypothetical protein